jgi:hypothetical protein
MNEEVPALLPREPRRLRAVGGVRNDGEREGTFERGEQGPGRRIEADVVDDDREDSSGGRVVGTAGAGRGAEAGGSGRRAQPRTKNVALAPRPTPRTTRRAPLRRPPRAPPPSARAFRLVTRLLWPVPRTPPAL